jgi:hypothetical protein
MASRQETGQQASADDQGFEGFEHDEVLLWVL